MKYYKLILTGLLVILSGGILYAQTDFRPGYIVKDSGDTLYGSIDYRGDLFMCSSCKFKDADNAINDYSPADIKEYKFIDSKYYISREIDRKRVFLEYLFNGEINIYFMRDDKGDHYYIDKEGEKLTEIPIEEDIKYINGEPKYVEPTRYIGVLSYFMQDAPGFQSRIQDIKKPQRHNLIKLAEDYHNVVHKDVKYIVYEKEVPFIKISAEPFTGLTKYEGYGYNSLTYELGGYLYIWLPRINEKIYFKTGLAYHKLSEEESELHIIKIPIQFQYIFRAHRIQPMVSAGFTILNIKLGEDENLAHTLSLNAGLNYRISNTVSINAGFNSDYTPISEVFILDDLKFGVVSYSIIVGLWIDL